VFTVLAMGTPVCSKSATAPYLQSIGFTAADLTLVAAAPVNVTDPDLAYVAWCTQATAQKLVTPDLFKTLMASANEQALFTEPAPPPVMASLPDGRTLAVPATPQNWVPMTSKKRKLSAVKRACGKLARGSFVLDDELLAGGKVHAEVRRVTFEPDAIRLKQLTSFAEMLMCMTVPPSIDNLHSWAANALRCPPAPSV
jgi:hypothetical protein